MALAVVVPLHLALVGRVCRVKETTVEPDRPFSTAVAVVAVAVLVQLAAVPVEHLLVALAALVSHQQSAAPQLLMQVAVEVALEVHGVVRLALVGLAVVALAPHQEPSTQLLARQILVVAVVAAVSRDQPLLAVPVARASSSSGTQSKEK